MSFLRFLAENARWLVAGFLATFFSIYGQTTFISLSAGDIRREYGLTHGEFGTVYMVATLASALTLTRLGQVVDRYSVAGVAMVVIPMLAVACISMAYSHHIAVLLFTIYLLRLFGQGMMVHNAYTATARWFSAQRGRALSITILGHNAGDAVMPILFVTLAGAIGWRNGWLLAAGSLILLATPIIVWLASLNRTPRASDPVQRISDARDWTRREVMRDPYLYLLMLAVMAPSFIVTVIFFHQVFLVESRGWSMEAFAASFAVSAAVNTCFTLLSGQLIDRFSGVALLPFVLLPLGAACLVLGFVEAQWSAFAFMALLGMSNGLSTTLFGAVWPEIYGLKHLGSIRALVVSFTVLASALGPGLTGFLIDMEIGYPGQIIAMGIYCVAVSGLMIAVSRRFKIRGASSVPPV